MRELWNNRKCQKNKQWKRNYKCFGGISTGKCSSVNAIQYSFHVCFLAHQQNHTHNVHAYTHARTPAIINKIPIRFLAFNTSHEHALKQPAPATAVTTEERNRKKNSNIQLPDHTSIFKILYYSHFVSLPLSRNVQDYGITFHQLSWSP